MQELCGSDADFVLADFVLHTRAFDNLTVDGHKITGVHAEGESPDEGLLWCRGNVEALEF